MTENKESLTAHYRPVIPSASTSAMLHVTDVRPMPSVSCGREPVSDALYEGFQNIDAAEPELYERYGVKRGLRNPDGSGVVAGLTTVCDVHGYRKGPNGVEPDEGDLLLRGYSIADLVGAVASEDRFGYEELAFLLISGQLPTYAQLADFNDRIDSRRPLPVGYLSLFPRTTASSSIMNVLQRATLLLYAFDDAPDATDPQHEVDVAISLLARLPRIAAIASAAYSAEASQSELSIPPIEPGLSMAETILRVLRGSEGYTRDEAKVLDTMLMLHAEHGGGNNSTFTCRVLSSSGTDPYSAYAAAMGSLKGPKHGGANFKVGQMIDDVCAHVADPADTEAMKAYLAKIAAGEAFDGTGLLYGIGHAVYTLSDPRAAIIRRYAGALAEKKGLSQRFATIEAIEDLAPRVVMDVRGTSKPLCANVDLYAGFVYDMLGIPAEMHTPIFAIARLAGWVAHRMEELYGAGRIIRPAYVVPWASTCPMYVPIAARSGEEPPLPAALAQSSPH
ncbi:citrate synthase [Atopobiaceae bacterium 24-176]